MAQHWSAYVRSVSQNQARALDRMAAKNGFRDGMSLLMHISGESRSKLNRADYLTMRGYLDTAFADFSG